MSNEKSSSLLCWQMLQTCLLNGLKPHPVNKMDAPLSSNFLRPTHLNMYSTTNIQCVHFKPPLPALACGGAFSHCNNEFLDSSHTSGLSEKKICFCSLGVAC